MTEPLQPMTDADIAAARKLADAATPGPWSAANGRGSASVRTDAPGFQCAIYLTVRTCEIDESVQRWQRDAEFIAASRTLVPILLAEVARLRAAVAGLANAQHDDTNEIANRERVTAALAGVAVDEEKERMRRLCEAACEWVDRSRRGEPDRRLRDVTAAVDAYRKGSTR